MNSFLKWRGIYFRIFFWDFLFRFWILGFLASWRFGFLASWRLAPVFFPEALRRVLPLKAAANFTCQLLMSTFRELFHLPTSLANFSRVTSPANLSCQLFESYFTCQLLMPTFPELLHLPTSHASFSRVTSPANFSCQLFGCYLIILKAQANFYFLPSHLDPKNTS